MYRTFLRKKPILNQADLRVEKYGDETILIQGTKTIVAHL